MGTRQLNHIVCPRCSCVCDDLRVTAADDSIENVEHACAKGEQWFSSFKNQPDLPSGQLDEATAAAAKILNQSRHALITGLEHATVNTVRAAIALAEKLGGTIDPFSSPGARSAARAMQEIGQVSATWGTVRQRADVMLCWDSDPIGELPRFAERMLDRSSPAIFWVGDDPTDKLTAARCEEPIVIKPGSAADSVTVLRSLMVQNSNTESTHRVPIRLDASLIEQRTGVSHERWQQLLTKLQSATYGAAWFADNTPHDLFFRLVRELNQFARWASLSGTSSGGGTAEQVMTWQTGFPYAVNFARGYPVFEPNEFTTEKLLERQEVDAVVWVMPPDGDSPDWSRLSLEARQYLDAIPVISLIAEGSCGPTLDSTAYLRFTIAADGIHTNDTIFRGDHVPLPLRPILKTQLPTASELLGAFAEKLATDEANRG